MRGYGLKLLKPIHFLIMEDNFSVKIKAIKNLRLFTNTADEWNIKYRQFENKQELLYKIICKECEERFQIDLDYLLDEYQKYSHKLKGPFDRYKRATFWKPEIIIQFLKLSLSPSPDWAQFTQIKEKYLKDLLDIDPTLLFCWIYGVLPPFDTVAGDITIDSYQEDFKKLEKGLQLLYPKDSIFTGKPFFEYLRKKFQTQLYNSSKTLTRMHLYEFANLVISNIRVLNDNEILYLTNENLIRLEYPNICEDAGVIWEDTNSGDLWSIILLGNGYYFKRFISVNKVYIQYEATIFEDIDNEIRLHLVSPAILPYFCKEQPAPESLYRFYKMEINDAQIKTIYQSGNLKDLPSKLIKKELTTKLKHKLSTYKNKYPQYDYNNSSVETLIGKDFLFIECTKKEIGNHLYKITSWYRIPRYQIEGKDLSYITIDDVILRINIDEQNYIFFPNLHISLNVTTPADCEKNKISIVSFPDFCIAEDSYYYWIEKTANSDIGDSGTYQIRTNIILNDSNDETFQENLCMDETIISRYSFQTNTVNTEHICDVTITDNV